MPNTLKLSSPMMHGPAVRRLQELCDELGYDTGPNDGIFGPATEYALVRVQECLGVTADGICGPKTWKALNSSIDDRPGSRGGVPIGGLDELSENEQITNRIYDIRKTHSRPHLFGGYRDWENIDAVVLHQTGCEMPQDPQGWSRLNAHIGITQEGKAILVNDPKMMIWHAQKLSRRSIGIEIEGNYPGLIDKPNTLWRGGGGPHTLNDAMLEATDDVFAWLMDEFEKNGCSGNWYRVHAHRQSSRTRTADPGEEIWSKVGMKWLDWIENSTDGGPAYKVGSGSPIPKEWDPKKTKRYWG